MNSDSNFYVFREGRRRARGEQLLRDLRVSLSNAADESGWTDALLRCGELECALEDAGSGAQISEVTDACAEALLKGDFRARELLRGWPGSIPEELTVTTPEGFAYYALHPLQYADAMEGIEAEDAVVVGIRSIGTTLSAVAAAALRRRGVRARRFTVRPEGDPFAREVQWSEAQTRTIRESAESAVFVIVDEGPGLSGSSFLSVAEALRETGVAEERTLLVPSHGCETSKLRARDAATRWARFRCVATGESRHPEGEWIGGGDWRRRFCGDEPNWPGAWTSLERAKFLADGVFWKFEGLGPYGARASKQAHMLAEAGFGPRVVDRQNGFLGSEMSSGQQAQIADLDVNLVERIADYCAFRAKHFCCAVSGAQREDFATMVRVNFEREFGSGLPESLGNWEMVRPAFCDAKIAPQEWLVSDGRMKKVDALSHGNDHFFPGPCDVAWDLAGAIVEWKMEDAARKHLLRAYRAASGDDATLRIESYLLAYSIFRCAWSRMAAGAMSNTPEEERLRRDYRRYRSAVEQFAALSLGR